MLNINEIQKSIKRYIYDISGVEVDLNDDILEMGLIQSMDFIMLISFISKHTNIELSEKDFNKENFRNLNAIISLIHSKQITKYDNS
jgi:acyl carrier protein